MLGDGAAGVEAKDRGSGSRGSAAQGSAGPRPHATVRTARVGVWRPPSLTTRSLRRAARRILLNYAAYNPAIGYSQGMSDLVAPILAEVLDESDTFWCFVGLMQNTIFVSSPRDEDMEKQLVRLPLGTCVVRPWWPRVAWLLWVSRKAGAGAADGVRGLSPGPLGKGHVLLPGPRVPALIPTRNPSRLRGWAARGPPQWLSHLLHAATRPRVPRAPEATPRPPGQWSHTPSQGHRPSLQSPASVLCSTAPCDPHRPGSTNAGGRAAKPEKAPGSSKSPPAVRHWDAAPAPQLWRERTGRGGCREPEGVGGGTRIGGKAGGC